MLSSQSVIHSSFIPYGGLWRPLRLQQWLGKAAGDATVGSHPSGELAISDQRGPEQAVLSNLSASKVPMLPLIMRVRAKANAREQAMRPHLVSRFVEDVGRQPNNAGIYGKYWRLQSRMNGS